jgi:hypothetical protein
MTGHEALVAAFEPLLSPLPPLPLGAGELGAGGADVLELSDELDVVVSDLVSDLPSDLVSVGFASGLLDA